MRGRTGGVVVLLALCLAGCEVRDRANPFDPRNPDTHGAPAILDAQAGNRTVSLRWDIGAISGVQIANLYRREIPEEPETRLTLQGIDPAAGAYVDNSVQNGIGYEYRLELELVTGAARSSAWDAATPGREIPWVADADGGGLIRLTPDGRDPVQRISTGYWFLDLAADTSSSTFWTAEYLRGSLSRYDPSGGRLFDSPVDGARAVAVSPDGANVWVASFRDGRIERRDATGTLGWNDIAGTHTEDLLGSADGGVWSAGWSEAGVGEVRYYLEDRLVRKFDGFVRPVALAEPEGDRVLVVDRLDRRLRTCLSSGSEGVSSGQIFVDPLDLCPDGVGGAWVADPGRGGIVRVNQDLEEVLFVPLPGVLGLTFDPSEGRIWAAGENGVQVLDLGGRIFSTLSLGGRPVKVEILFAPESP